VTTLTEIYGAQAEEAREAMDFGPLVLSGLPGSGAHRLALELLDDGAPIQIVPRRAATSDGLRFDLARSILRFLALHSGGATPYGDFELRVTKAFGSRAREALRLGEGEDAPDLSLTEIAMAIPGDAAVVVSDAHLLAQKWANRATWALRRRCQAEEPPRVVLLTRPWHANMLTGPDSAFLGFAQTIELTTPEPWSWGRAVDDFPTDAVTRLIERTRGLPVPTLAVLARAREHKLSVANALASEIEAARPKAEAVERLAHGLHPYGPRLLAAVAANTPVYPAVPGARTDAIAAALRILRDHDLVYQPSQRRWVIADPTVAPHFASYAPDWFVWSRGMG
jgi:hypothetical protein